MVRKLVVMTVVAFGLNASATSLLAQQPKSGGSVETATGEWTKAIPGGQSTSMCPTRHHVVGLNVKGSERSVGFCVGCVTSVQVVCAPDSR